MDTVRRIIKNTVVRTGAEILNFAISAIFLIYVTRHLGSADFGKYSFALSFAGLFVILTDMGLHTIFIREVAKEKKIVGKYIGNLLLIKSILALLTYLILVITINLMDYPSETTQVVYMMGIFVIGTSFLDLFNSLFRAFEQMEYEALIMSLNRLAVAVSGISTLYFGYGLLGFTIAIVVANLLSIIPSFFLASRGISFKKVEIDITIWKYLFKKAIPIGLMMLFITIYLKAGTVILSLMKDDSAVGIYSAPHRLIEALIIFPTFFLAALFPVLIRFHQSFSDALFKTYEGSFKFLFILVLPMAVVTTMLAEKLTIGIFGMEFINSAIVLRILIWACSLIFLNTLLSYLIIAIDRQRFNVISFGIGALFNVILNLILVPLYSYIGASIALVASQAVIFTLNFIFISFRQFRLPLPGTILKPVFASLFLGFIVWNMKEINLFVVVFTGSIMYFAMLVLLRAFSQEDILMVRTLVGLRQI